MAPKILIVLTSAGKFEKSGKPTGCPPPQGRAHRRLPNGGEAPLDPSSIEATKDDPASVSFLKEHKSVYQNTKKLSDLAATAADDFDAVFYPGGHGPMYDLVNDKDSIKIISETYAKGKPVAAVCHGPVVFVNVNGPDTLPILKGKRVTGFSDVEEEQMKLVDEMPFSLEKALNEKSGGKFEKAAEPWGEKVIVHDNVITGQNPASAKGSPKSSPSC
ncbi:unnamed protein product [Parascedosporium putredinis]|uniref:D-lactate dehydratase n=1 Tax=Parascedosporium putredinis TaxID=1442378 RepID=A0A9P1H3N4_9PEZI|nr:unnamed protein product [Parascedosporium putredinis]CAI7994898.1 unnamed protein product [Parascedosporium putredinis]